MLVSDLALDMQPGAPRIENLRYDFKYEYDETLLRPKNPSQFRTAEPWQRNPSAFTTFAEFSEPVDDVPEHVDDTGRIFRAFLPFQDAQSRETITKYAGKALVMDARVSCQRPQVQHLRMEYKGEKHSYAGSFSKTEDLPGLVGSASSLPFDCPLAHNLRPTTLIICQPMGFEHGEGRVLSELRDSKQWPPLDESWKNGSFVINDRANTAYLIFNVTLPESRFEDNVTRNISTASGHGSWTEVSYVPLFKSSSHYMNISVTLCYPALWSARLSVDIHSPHNRTEPRDLPFNGLFRTTPDIHAQMGEFKHDHEQSYAFNPAAIGENSQLIKRSTLEHRGILSLAPKDSWLPDPIDAAQFDIVRMDDGISGTLWVNFIARFAGIPWSPSAKSFNSSFSWNLDSTETTELKTDPLSPYFTLASIFTASLQATNDSAATALSTIITTLASMAYYDQFPSFAETAHNASTTFFQTFLFSQSFRGFTAVLAITVAHCVLVLLIIAAFLVSTRLSTLGDHWQTISQTISPATEDFLKNSSCATNKEVRQGLKAEHREHEMVNLQPLADGDGRVGLVARKSRRRSSHDMGLE